MLAILIAAAAIAPPADPSPYFLDGSVVAQVVCDASSGSAFYIGDGRWITASHVLGGRHCRIHGALVHPLERDRGLDFAMVRAAFFPAFRAILSCARLQEGEVYFATGYAEGNPWPVTTRVMGAGSRVDRSAEQRGSIVLGMSGGPIADRDGAIHAINDWQMDDGVPDSGAVELADTPLCKEKN